ncbi:RNA-directed DNA polymerase from mobile element jockey-like protein [Elysia marginata]|uniref:RNA-directed DNA polymerase from mobile element jockey-like protein n=1 Tax=Elysia marginata TaxID=1093978 RepID=A0AAV4H9E9_9GAST|nr:RNA-directed DNA polymerase from mobile element jockey-like protein [Elysia marginata]
MERLCYKTERQIRPIQGLEHHQGHRRQRQASSRRSGDGSKRSANNIKPEKSRPIRKNVHRSFKSTAPKKLSLADSVELNKNIYRDRQYVRIVQRVANSECLCPPDGYCAPFNKKELEASLAQLKNTSLGDDQIHNKLLTHLPPSGKMALLTLFNRVYKSGQYPAAWRKGTIIPILKAGKDPAFMSSYRPIQLASCLGKLFEKLVKVRMNYWLESEKLLNPKQAGFRSLKSTEDQVT